MTYRTDPRVDAYIGKLPGWPQAICREVRDLTTTRRPLTAMFKQIIANNRAGGWRKLKPKD